MVNRTGNNGTDNGERPPDDILRASLLRYASLKLTIAQKLENLAAEHNYHIKPTKLKALNAELSIPVVRKPPPLSVITTLVCDKLDDDVNQANGPDAIKTFLALDGYQVPRDKVCQVMKDNAPAAAKTRYPGNKEKIIRKNLTAQGVFQEVHCDGHEKLASAALKMGPVGISIYSFREKATGLVAHLVTVPDARQSVVIGHIYLDFIEEFGAFPIQITVDKGSETGEMYAAHTGFRKTYTPDLNPIEWPEFVALKSVNNIVIENLWKWLLKTIGRSLREVIEDGKTNGLFNPGNQIHVDLFHWLWPKIVQIKLDEFKLYWNHRDIEERLTLQMRQDFRSFDVLFPEEMSKRKQGGINFIGLELLRPDQVQAILGFTVTALEDPDDSGAVGFALVVYPSVHVLFCHTGGDRGAGICEDFGGDEGRLYFKT
ncbi:hypothetical protein DFH06DRAFT_1140788 [Mycena polygramma]|nr:hypothetical protein DFH06DRAFT_1140788 [Mycena polygramma]